MAEFRAWTYEGQDPYEGENGDTTAAEYGDGIEQRAFSSEWMSPRQQFRWQFRKTEVWVKELKLVGPKDLGGLEVKMPKEKSTPGKSSLGMGPKGAAGSKPEAGADMQASTCIPAGEVGPSSTPGPKPTKEKGAGTTLKVKTTTAAPQRKDKKLADQYTNYNNARSRVKAKAEAKQRRRPTAKEKWKGKAVDPVDKVDPGASGGSQGNYKDGGLEVIVNVDAPVVEGDSEEKDVSEEE